MGLDPTTVGDWLAGLDDDPIPLPWRGHVHYAPPPDAARGRRIAAFWAMSTVPSAERDLEALEKILAGKSWYSLAIGDETCEAIIEAGIPAPALEAMARICLVRWATGSEELARQALERERNRSTPAVEPEVASVEAPPKSRAGSGRKTLPRTASASRTRTAGTPTT